MAMKKDKKKEAPAEKAEPLTFGKIVTTADLKTFLLNVRDKMTEEIAAPIYALSALNHVMSLTNIYQLLDNECKEIARDIWLRLRQAGLQLRNPPMLFGDDETISSVNTTR